MADAKVRTERVLAKPGTPSSNTCPLASRPTRSRSTNACWPTTTLPTVSRKRVTQVDACRTRSFNASRVADMEDDGGATTGGGGAQRTSGGHQRCGNIKVLRNGVLVRGAFNAEL